MPSTPIMTVIKTNSIPSSNNAELIAETKSVVHRHHLYLPVGLFKFVCDNFGLRGGAALALL